MQDKVEIKDEKSEKIYEIDDVVELLKSSWNGKKWEFNTEKEEVSKGE